MVRQVEVTLPRVAGMSSGVVQAIAFQDLPGRAIGTYHAVPPGLKGTVGMGLLSLAVGSGVDLEVYGYEELQDMFVRWKLASDELAESGDDSEESWTELDWGDIL